MFDVQLYIYDLSFGIARTLSPLILGKCIEGIWHTGIVVHGKEYFYGSHGISYCLPGSLSIGAPGRILPLGCTRISESTLHAYLEELSHTVFKGGDYRLFDHNCNTFSNHLAEYLVGRSIPAYILNLPAEVESTPLGAALKPAIAALSAGIDNIPQFGQNEPGNSNNTSELSPGPATAALTAAVSDSGEHSLGDLSESFHPILFDEPLPSTLVERRLKLLWPDLETDSRKAELAADVFRVASESNKEVILGPEHFSMLALDLMQTEDQCLAVLELFRLAVLRNSDLFNAMLTDPGRHLHRLPQVTLPSVNVEKTLDLHAAQAKLLVNCLGQTCSGLLQADDQFRLPLGSIVHLALLLLDHVDHQLDWAKVTPQHRLVGLALSHNLALCPWLSCDEEALELGSYLIHLSVQQDEAYNQPIEMIYLLRTIYFLVVRFPLVADLARTTDLCGLLATALSGVTTDDDMGIPNRFAMIESPSVDGAASVDYFIAVKLLDFLGKS